jgi:hypothetical protein
VEFSGEGGGDGSWDHAGDIAAESGDLLDDAGADVGEDLAGGEEDGFEVRAEGFVHEGHLEFVFEVCDGAETADDHASAGGGGEVDEEPFEGSDLDVREGGDALADEGDPVFGGEEGVFGVVVSDGDEDVVEEPGGAFDLASDRRYAGIAIPTAESLKDTIARVLPYWEARIAPELKAGKRVVISAHGNSLRALVKHLSGISDDEISSLEIPTGQPIVYDLADDLSARDRYYLSER